jgi:transposase
MGVNDREFDRKQARRKTGSERLEKLRGTRNHGSGVAFNALDPSAFLNGIAAVTRSGAAIMFGLTSDGGAMVVTVLDNNDREKEYLHDADEINEYLVGLAVLYEG